MLFILKDPNSKADLGRLSSVVQTRGTEDRRHDEMGHLKTIKTRYREGSHLFMVSATAGTSARRTMFSKPRYLMLGSRTLMNLPSIATPAPPAQAGYFSQVLRFLYLWTRQRMGMYYSRWGPPFAFTSELASSFDIRVSCKQGPVLQVVTSTGSVAWQGASLSCWIICNHA